MPGSSFDAAGRFVIPDYAAARPFASFLPGIAGPHSIPLWVMYVNRGQAVASFGIQDKENPVLEFQPANKAYMQTPYSGFRTFIKLARGSQRSFYEPFSPWHRSASTCQHMAVGMNELELEETNPDCGLQVNVLYFTLPGEDMAALVRSVRLKNVGHEPAGLEILDGMPAVIPYGVTNRELKAIGRTIEAWMEVVNFEQRVPFYRLPTRAEDVAEVETIEAGHFALSFTASQGELLPVLVDPSLVFGQNTALSAPDNFLARPLAELLARRQVAVGRTPCGFFAASASLTPSEEITLVTIIGHTSSFEHLQGRYERLLNPAYVDGKRREGNELIRRLTDAVATQTGSPTFDAYCRQTFLDNVMRGGWPLLLGGAKHPLVYHIYSRKHGDLERDYNDFYLAAEYYSQGNGNYRDVNQNRRCDVLLNPGVGDYNVRSFVSLLQADGYNPLVVLGSRFTLPAGARAAVLAHVVQPEQLEAVLSHPFTPGHLLKYVEDHPVELRLSPDEFLRLVLENAEQHFEATFGEGYWIDHWTYNMDLVETFLAVYPDRQDELLFGDPSLPFFDSPAIVRRRSQKYVLAGGRGRQFGAVVEDEEKAAAIAARSELPNLVRVAHGLGAIYRTSLFGKLLSLALLKFATMDPGGMGIEMEANKPGWCDAMNGLPSLFGSSMPESYELKRLLAFLQTALYKKDKGDYRLDWPVELCALLRRVVEQVKAYQRSDAPERDWDYWDAVASAREDYRDSTRLGFSGETQSLEGAELAEFLSLALGKVQAGLERAAAMSDGVPPTYFSYQVEDYELVCAADGTPQQDAQGRPRIRARRFEPAALPSFLEGPARALKVQTDRAAARRLYEQVKASPLFDRKLGMYRLNTSLAGQPHEIGRARAFTPGWLENESIWLHMEYKYMLAVLQAGLYDEFFQDFKTALIPFQDPAVYGRSPLENSSFLVSSAHPDESLHGVGFVARLSGSTAEFLSMWTAMMAGPKPFLVQDGQLCLALRPALPGWLFDEKGTITFRFLGSCTVTYHNPARLDTFREGVRLGKLTLHTRAGQTVEYSGGMIKAPHADMVRRGEVDTIHVYVEEISQVLP
jgi:hypothetical protein